MNKVSYLIQRLVQISLIGWISLNSLVLADDNVEQANFSFATGNLYLPIVEIPLFGAFGVNLLLVDESELEFVLQDIQLTTIASDSPTVFSFESGELFIPAIMVAERNGQQVQYTQVNMISIPDSDPLRFQLVGISNQQGKNIFSLENNFDFNSIASARLTIETAKWEPEESQLRVQGKGNKNKPVTISNAYSGQILGMTTTNNKGKWELEIPVLAVVPCQIQAKSDNDVVKKSVEQAPPDCDTKQSSNMVVLAANDLGMHCADLDYQILSILPPFNVVHVQVLQRGTHNTLPQLLDDSQVEVIYQATSNPKDPIGKKSINTGNNSQNGTKSNFWESADSLHTIGGLAYRSLYPSQDKLGLCDPFTEICLSSLDLFEPLASDTGLPVPDPLHLPSLVPFQQAMPGISNSPQYFKRFDVDLPFFKDLPFGSVIQQVRWFAADGIPIVSKDDNDNLNAYPLMRIQAIAKDTAPTPNDLATLDIVLPVSSEADCQTCHAHPGDFGNGAATRLATVKTYADGTPWKIMRQANAPPPEKLINSSKINILRLHDAKHGTHYTSSADGSSTPCNSGTEPTCLANRTPVQCSQCHYSPALDLAQTGPVDEPEPGEAGRQQTRHISMSRAMHDHHGQFTELFPNMLSPDDPQRTPAVVQQLLEKSCYQCHPGKKTSCLRGVMAQAGIVCQDCHGNMNQIGNDFSGGLPTGEGLDLTKRIPWANEPQCQSCHIGDAVTIAKLDTTDFILANSGIRLLQTYQKSVANEANLPFITMPQSRFAENESLYRLSKGHGGIMCEGCHGSPHAIWPVSPSDNAPNSSTLANDNLAAIALQGHAGKLIECTTCHEAGSLKPTLKGPHGLHPVNDPTWNKKHEELVEKNKNACRACHGLKGEGTVLARVAADRTLQAKEEQPDGSKTITLKQGTMVSCDLCHQNELVK